MTNKIYHIGLYSYRPLFGMRTMILHKNEKVAMFHSNTTERRKTLNGAKKFAEKFAISHTNGLLSKDYNFLAVMCGNEIICEYDIKAKTWEDVNFKLTND